MKTYIITGGNSGLGFETAKQIARTDARIILACRNLQKGDAAAAVIREETGNQNVEVRELDLASLRSVSEFAASLDSTGIDGLDNNAGISNQHTGITEDGIDVVFQSNFLGHFLLTMLLLPQMNENARILNISSDMHNPPYVDLVWKGTDCLIDPDEETMKLRYYYAKLCNLYFTYELDRRLRDQGRSIVVNALNPGFMADTNLAGGNMSADRIEYVRENMPDRYGELSVSADAAADILTEEAYGTVSGKYFDRSTNTARSSDLSYNRDNAAGLWETARQLTGMR